MFVDDVKASAEHRLNQITHTLKHVHGIELTLDESSMDEIELLHDSSEIVKNSIVSESAFNSWHTNPAYTKHMLIMEAVRLYLTEIAPKRRPRHLRESEEGELNEAYINTNKDAIDVLANLRKIGKSIELGQGKHEGNLANEYAEAVWDVYTFIEAKTKGFQGVEQNAMDAIKAMMQLRKTAKDMERNPGSGSNAQFGNQIVNTLYPVMQYLASINESVTLDESHITKVGRWMMDFAEKTHTKDDKLLAMLNSFGRVGEDLVRVGQPFSPKTLKELIAYYEARIGDKNDDPDDRRQAKENLMALRMGHTMYDKYNAKKAGNSAPVKEDSVEHMADASAAAQDMDPELAALMKKYGVSAGHKMDEAKKAKPDFLDIDKDGNKKEPMKKAVADKKKANAHVKKVDEKMTSRIAQAINENHMQHHDYQASMARSELYRNAKYGMDMLKQVHEDDEIEPWIASALTISASYLDKIYHYMDYYMNAEPGALSEDAPMPDMDMEPDMDPAEDLGETTGSIARMNLLQIVDDSIKLFHMIQPGDKLEGWVAMKLTKASEGISSSKHYLDYKNFERHASEDFALDEGRYSIVARMLREAAETPEQDLQQAQTLIAAKSISDDLQSMAEKVARMGVDDLMPLVDTMKTQFGPEAADAYNEVMKAQLEELLQSVQTAKDSSDDAVLALQSGSIPGAGSTDIENMDTDLGTEPGMEEPVAPEMGDGTGTMPAAAGGEEPLGRAKKAAPGEEIPALAEGRKRVAEKWGTEMKTAEKDKGKWDGYTLAELKAKKKKLMDKEERSAAEQKTVKQIDFAIRAKQKDKFGAIKEETTTTKDDRAEKAGRKVAKDIEYDERKKDGIHGAKRGAEDNKAERAGRKVAKDIEYDDKTKKKVTEEIAKAGISDELAAKKIATKIMGTPDLNIPKIKQLVTKYLSMVGKAPTDVTHLAALVATELENKGVMEAKKAKPDFLDVDKDGDKKEPMKKAIKDKAKKVDEAKSKSPYAIGMWQAKKEAGMDPDKPAKDLPKKVVKKAHEIGASIEGTDESIKRLGGLVEKALRGKRKYEADLAEHRAEFAKRIAEGKVKDLLKSGQGLEGDLLEKKIAEVNTMSTDLKQQIRMLEAASRAKLFAVIKEERRSVRFAEARATKPWGVMYEGQHGARMTRFFEAEKARDYWAQLNSSVKPKLINPEHFDRVAAK